MSFKVTSSGMHQRPEVMSNLFFKQSVTLIWDSECGTRELLDSTSMRVGYLKKNYTIVYFVTITIVYFVTITLGYTCTYLSVCDVYVHIFIHI